MSKATLTTLMLAVFALALLPGSSSRAAGSAIAPRHGGAGPIQFLAAKPGWRAYGLDSAFDPTPMVGVLDPAYESGGNQLSILTRRGAAPGVARAVALGEEGFVLAFDLSPDGDTALVGRHAPDELIVVRGLAGGEPRVAAVLPAPAAPLSFAFAPDGSFAVVGNQAGPGEASLTIVSGLPDEPSINGVVPLGIAASALSAVESVDLSHDGDRLLVQTALHDDPTFPGLLLPRITLQVVRAIAPGLRPEVSDPLLLPRDSALPSQPPFADLPTGVALGDSCLLCDGDWAIVPVSGSLDLGQPDARIFFVRGVESGVLEIVWTLSVSEGVGVGPLQVALAPDCERAIVTNVFSGDASEIGGLADPASGVFEVAQMALGYPFPAEPAIAPNGETLWVHHPRVPLDGAPPAAVTVFDLHPGEAEPVGDPIIGPVRAWLQAKDRTLAAYPPSLTDYLLVFTRDLPARVRRPLYAQVQAAILLAEMGLEPLAAAFLVDFDGSVVELEAKGRLTVVEARVLRDLVRVGLRRLGR